MDKGCRQREASSLEGLTEAQKDRALHADEIYCKACEDSGIHISSWHNFKSWHEYVDGKIDDAELSEKARSELDQFSKSFGKYVVIKKDDPKQAEDETEKKKRAKQAGKIYREVCGEAGITICFFHDFISWSDFVEGKIDESEFHERVKREIREITAKHH